MSPRPAPDLDLRREEVLRAARDLAEREGWAALTMRRLAAGLAVTQPVLYTVFASRQALVDAVALGRVLWIFGGGDSMARCQAGVS